MSRAGRVSSDRPENRRIFSAFLLSATALVFILYGRTLSAPFVFDDVLMTKSKLTQATSLSAVGSVLTAAVPRKVTRASFALNFYLDRLDPFGYHLVNLLIHALNGVLLFVLARALLRLLPETHPWRRHTDIIAFLGSTIWLVHPVQTQAVSYVWQRATCLGALFYLTCVLAYVKARTASGVARIVLFAAAAVTAVLALATKENAGSLPGALALVEIALIRPRRSHDRERPGRIPMPVVAASVVTMAIAMNYLGPRFLSMMAADFDRRGFSLIERLLTETRVVVYYISLLIVPSPGRLTVDYDFAVSRGLFDPMTTAASLAVVTGLLGIGLVSLRRAPLLAFPILWFFGLLAIESTVVPLDLAYEHRLYLPSMIPIMCGVAGVVTLIGAQRIRVLWVSAAAVVVLFSVWTWQRNELWRDPVKLWTDTARKSPTKARVHGNLAKARLDAGDPAGALGDYERASALAPTLPEPISAQALIYMDHFNDVARARELLNEAVRRSPRYVPALVNLGVLQMRAGEMDAAAATFARVIERDHEEPIAIYNLAALSFNRRDYADAERRLLLGIANWPAHVEMRALLGLVYMQTGDRARSEQTLAAAHALAPRDPMVRAARQELMKHVARSSQ